jgi:nitroreductase
MHQKVAVMAGLQAIAEPGATRQMGVIEAIRRRRATRSFTGEPVGKPAIRALLDAAVHAPTAMHEEPWVFAVVQDKLLLKQLSDDAKEGLAQAASSLGAHCLHRMPGFTMPENIFYDAGTLIVIYGKPLGPFVVADCWLAAENLMLAACATGFATCVIGLSVGALNSAKWKAQLDVPAELTAYAPIIVGVPRGETPATSRNEPDIAAWVVQE